MSRRLNVVFVRIYERRIWPSVSHDQTQGDGSRLRRFSPYSCRRGPGIQAIRMVIVPVARILIPTRHTHVFSTCMLVRPPSSSLPPFFFAPLLHAIQLSDLPRRCPARGLMRKELARLDLRMGRKQEEEKGKETKRRKRAAETGGRNRREASHGPMGLPMAVALPSILDPTFRCICVDEIDARPQLFPWFSPRRGAYPVPSPLFLSFFLPHAFCCISCAITSSMSGAGTPSSSRAGIIFVGRCSGFADEGLRRSG